jgi:hypothetical protein
MITLLRRSPIVHEDTLTGSCVSTTLHHQLTSSSRVPDRDVVLGGSSGCLGSILPCVDKDTPYVVAIRCVIHILFYQICSTR